MYKRQFDYLLLLMEIGFCGNSLDLIMSEMCWDGIEQRETWHETDGGYLWILVVWTLDLVASATMLLTDLHLVDLTADVWTHSD